MIKQLNLDHSLVLSYIFIYNLFNYFPPNSFCLRDCLFDTKTIGRLPYERVDFQRRLYTFQSTSTDDLTVGFQLSVILKFYVQMRAHCVKPTQNPVRDGVVP